MSFASDACAQAARAGDVGAFLEAHLAARGARRVADIGCGGGALLRRLTRAGFAPVGVDPSAAALARARTLVGPDVGLVEAGAEALPLANGAFDAAIFLNSLHHVPVPHMDRALAEAARVVRPGGEVVVVEPLAEGSFFEAMCRLDDETAIRQAALDVLDRAGRLGSVIFDARHTLLRRQVFGDLDAFLAALVAVDPERAAGLEALRPELAETFARVGERAPDGETALTQPLLVAIGSRVPA